MPTTRKLQLIKDSAASEDFFGGHKRVAKALAYLLRDPAVRLIALLGPWGSGKSTVVGLAEGAISETTPSGAKAPHFFIFDAWLHQSDSPRRALIESLVAFVRQKEICPDIDWEDDLEAIQRRAEIQEVKTTPSLTAWGFFIGLTLLFVPLGVRLADSRTIVDLGRVGFLYANVIGLFITFLPVILVALNYLSWRHTINPFNDIFFAKNNWLTHNEAHKDRTMASMFFNKAVERTTNKIIKTPEPTSFEFRAIYTKIMNAVGVADGSLVIIIDNLDRIPAEEAIAFWSTIRSLLIHDSSSGETKYRPWVIVPLDAGAIERIFTKADTRGEARFHADAFVEKTFDATLRVTPPVTSDWQNYLKEKLEFATSDSLAAEDTHVAVKIFEASAALFREQNSTTPRRINAYVNRIISVLLQWESELPLSAVCYHAAFSDRLDPFSEIIDDSAPGASLMNSIDPDWRQNVAAIHFGVATGKALQILMGPEIASAILNEDVERFLELSQSPGFEIVLGRVIESVTLPATDFDVFSAAALLDRVESGSLRNSDAWDALLKLARSTAGRTEAIRLATNGVAALVKRGGASISRHLLGVLKVYGPEAARAGGSAWFAEIWACDPGVEGRKDLTKGLLVPGDALFYTQAIDAAVKLGARDKWEQLVRDLQPSVGRDEIVDLVARQAATSSFDQGWYDRIVTLRWVSGAWNFGPIFDAADTAIRNPENDLDLYYALRAILDDHEAAAKRLSSLGVEGILANRMAIANSLDHFDEAGALLLAIASYYPSIDPNQHYEESAAGVSIIRNLSVFERDNTSRVADAIVEALLGFGTQSNLLAMLSLAHSEQSWRPLAVDVIDKLLKTEYFDWFYATDLLVAYDSIRETLGDVSRALVERLSKDATFEKRFMALEIDLFFRVANVFLSDQTSEALASKIAERFEGLGEQWWLAQFQASSPAIRVLETLAKSFGNLAPPEGFVAAASEYVKWLIQNGPYYPSDGPVDWELILDGLDDDRRMVFDQNIIDRINNVSQEVAACVIYTFANEIIRPGVFERDIDRNVRMILLPIIASADEASLSDLKDVAELFAPFVARAEQSTRTEMARIAAEKIELGLQVELIQSILKMWSIIPAKARPSRRKKNAIEKE